MSWVYGPFKIISHISNKAKRLSGVNTGYSQEKPTRLTRNKKKKKKKKKKGFLSHFTRPEPKPTMVSWLCDSETVLLTCYLKDRQNCNTENCLCFIQLILLYEQKSFIHQKLVCNRFLQLKRLCERTFKCLTSDNSQNTNLMWQGRLFMI